MAQAPPPWVQTLRRALKAEHGRGWSVREQSERVQLTRRFEDGTRSSVVLEIAWNAGCISKVIERVNAIRDQMESQKLPLARAHELLKGAPVEAPGRLDWPLVVSRYQQSRIDSGEVKGSTWQREIAPRMVRVLSTLGSRPTPREGASLMELYARQHLGQCKHGGAGRKRNLLDVAGLLRFAVTSCGASNR